MDVEFACSAQFPKEPAAPLVPHFPRFRALALFGRRPLQRGEGLVIAGGRKPTQDRTPPASAPLGKKWMGGTARTPLLDISQGGLQVLLGQRDPELVAQHASIFVLAFKGPAFDFT
jgi:hypothetical protein